jgi:vacuolar-type H+-ATPase subunit H
MEDYEALKVIKEREEAISHETQEYMDRMEAEIRSLEESLKNRILETEAELNRERESTLAKVTSEAEAEASRIIEVARLKSERMKLRMKDSEIFAAFEKLLKKYGVDE